jgi:hypothetical protein
MSDQQDASGSGGGERAMLHAMNMLRQQLSAALTAITDITGSSSTARVAAADMNPAGPAAVVGAPVGGGPAPPAVVVTSGW